MRSGSAPTSFGRVYPGSVHRSPPPDANAVRQKWRALVESALGLARSVLASEGREVAVALDFRHDLTRAPTFPLPASDVAVACVVRGFRDGCAALLGARTPERRLLLAPVVEAQARAMDGLLDEELAPYVALSRRISGDPEGEL